MLTLSAHAIPLQGKLMQNMSAAEFFQFAQANGDLRMERDEHGNIFIMSPTGAETGRRNAKLISKLDQWNDQALTGYVFDSSTGFQLTEKLTLSPDVSWIEKSRWEALSLDERKRFAPICPDFVLELLSPSDAPEETARKMEKWLAHGARLGWLIAPEAEQATIFRPGEAPVTQPLALPLSGAPVLPGFTLHWAKLGL